MPFENQNFNSRTYFYHLNIRLVRYSDCEFIFNLFILVCLVLYVFNSCFFPDPDSVSKGRGQGRSRNDKEFKVIWQHCFFYFQAFWDIWQHCFKLFVLCLFGHLAKLFFFFHPFWPFCNTAFNF